MTGGNYVPIKASIGDVVQLDPNNTGNKMFAGCMLTVTHVYDWGVMGYVQSLGENGNIGGAAYYRAEWDSVEYVGKAVWIIPSGDDNE